MLQGPGVHTQEDPLALVPTQEEHPTQGFRALLAGSLLTLAALSAPPVAAAPQPIHIADRNWESGSLITDLLRIIVESGYGLPTDTLPGTTITLETALANNDIQMPKPGRP